MLPDVNYSNSLDDSYCIEMQKAARLAIYVSISKVQIYTLLYVGYWLIHSYTFTSGLTNINK